MICLSVINIFGRLFFMIILNLLQSFFCKPTLIYENILVCNSKIKTQISWSGLEITSPVMFIDIHLHRTDSFVFQHEVGHIKNNHMLKLLVFKMLIMQFYIILDYIFSINITYILIIILINLLSILKSRRYEKEADLYAVYKCSTSEVIIGMNHLEETSNFLDPHPKLTERKQYIKRALKIKNRMSKNN